MSTSLCFLPGIHDLVRILSAALISTAATETLDCISLGPMQVERMDRKGRGNRIKPPDYSPLLTRL